MTSSSTLRSIETLMTGLIDYAGLFPPSQLDMAMATQNYARDLRSSYERFLSRFICPASRLDELSEHGAALMPGTYATSGYREHADFQDPWQISAIIIGDLEENLERIYAFNERHDSETNGLAMVDALEMKIGSPSEIDDLLDTIPEMIVPAFELPKEVIFGGDPRGFVAAMAGTGAVAKIRCGGVTSDLFPSSADIARFIVACHRADVPFKATAGLHHPLRSEHALTYEPNAPRGVMHGFVNVFLAGAMVRHCNGFAETEAVRLLDDGDASHFRFESDRVGWTEFEIDVAQLAQARESFATGYGSCSFKEPTDDLKSLGWL
ncbi:MAG: hypothetical protein KDA29_09990 [Phycisphaerales bacterium]|nr:hypothetical protein [Phycisphaerales bacterium]